MLALVAKTTGAPLAGDLGPFVPSVVLALEGVKIQNTL